MLFMSYISYLLASAYPANYPGYGQPPVPVAATPTGAPPTNPNVPPAAGTPAGSTPSYGPQTTLQPPPPQSANLNTPITQTSMPTTTQPQPVAPQSGKIYSSFFLFENKFNLHAFQLEISGTMLKTHQVTGLQDYMAVMLLQLQFLHILQRSQEAQAKVCRTHRHRLEVMVQPVLLLSLFHPRITEMQPQSRVIIRTVECRQ